MSGRRQTIGSCADHHHFAVRNFSLRHSFPRMCNCTANVGAIHNLSFLIRMSVGWADDADFRWVLRNYPAALFPLEGSASSYFTRSPSKTANAKRALSFPGPTISQLFPLD